ncbi:UpxY family transcription antiterminator [Niabella terrae]
MNKQWHVVYTKPRWEKKVMRLLSDKEIEAYCPLNRVKKKWSDRIKTVEIPLFSSYVFVNIEESQKIKVRETEGVLNFIYTEHKPAIVRDWEIEKIRRFLSEYEDVELVRQPVARDQTVYVKKGLFTDEKGRVLDLRNNKVTVEIDSLGYNLVAVFDISELTINPNEH